MGDICQYVVRYKDSLQTRDMKMSYKDFLVIQSKHCVLKGFVFTMHEKALQQKYADYRFVSNVFYSLQ